MAIVAVAIIAVIGWYLPMNGGTIIQKVQNLGVENCLTDAITCFTAVNTDDGYYIDGYAKIGTTGIVTDGGGVHTSSTPVSSTLTTDMIDTENMIDLTLENSDESITLMSSSSLTTAEIIPNAGDTRTFYLRNATTSATIDMTLVGGTGVALKSASTTSGVTSYVLLGDSDGKSMFQITLLRLATTDVIADVEKLID
jgi:hypothetical protein